MDTQTALAIIERSRAGTKAADDAAPFVDAVRRMANQQLRSDALHDVRNLAGVSLGLGMGGRGLVGLWNLMRSRRKDTRSGPAELPLPYPVEPLHDTKPRARPGGGSVPGTDEFINQAKAAGWGEFLAGREATSKAGIPWYGPAMMLGGLGALGAGWKGMDAVLDRRRESARQRELEDARRGFHDALLAQYDRPLDSPTHSMTAPVKKAADDSTMTKVGHTLDRAYDLYVRAMTLAAEKRAVDWANLGGATLGGYGMYAGLTGLLAGSMVYDKSRKRNRAAIIQKALQRRERRRFMQQPPEIYATPEPIAQLPRLDDSEREDPLRGGDD